MSVIKSPPKNIMMNNSGLSI
jgi:hypothetical protein